MVLMSKFAKIKEKTAKILCFGKAIMLTQVATISITNMSLSK